MFMVYDGTARMTFSLVDGGSDRNEAARSAERCGNCHTANGNVHEHPDMYYYILGYDGD